MKQVTIITGPTASGKTSYAKVYSEKFEKSIIINADASAVYKGFPILTANFENEFKRENFLFEICDLSYDFSVGKWLNSVAEILEDEKWKNHKKIIVGGTCMYVFLLINGLVQMPEIMPEIRKQVTAEFEKLGSEEFYKKVFELDKTTNKDKQRMINNYSLILQTGKTFAEWQKEPKKMFLKEGEFELIKINPERKILYENCNLRFLKMLNQGGVEEVKKAMENYGETYDFKKILGANEIRDFILKKITQEEMILKVQQRTRNLAKSQVTWLSNKL